MTEAASSVCLILATALAICSPQQLAAAEKYNAQYLKNKNKNKNKNGNGNGNENKIILKAFGHEFAQVPVMSSL